MAVLLAGLPTSVPGRDGEPAVRVEPGRGDGRLAHDRDRRRRRRPDRRRRVDDPRAVGAAQARARVPGRQQRGGLDDAGLAAGQPEHAGRMDGVAGRGQRAAAAALLDLARAAGRVRRPLAPARPTPPGRPASTTRSRSASTASTSTATRASGRRAPSSRWPSSSPPSARTGRSPPATPRRSTTAPRPCCSAAGCGRRRDRARPARPHRRPRGHAPSSRRSFGYAPVEAANRALRRAGIGWADVGRGRAQRGVRGPVAGLRRRVEGRPRDRQRQGRRDRDRPPARRVRRPHPRHAGRAACASRASAGASPRSASASARAWPWCWRT